jgi:hypothetical protein
MGMTWCMFYVSVALQDFNESRRVQNGTLGDHNESRRVQNGILGDYNESRRVQNGTPRDYHESRKVQNGTLRDSNESRRVQNDTSRDYNESRRVQNGTLGGYNESRRVQKWYPKRPERGQEDQNGKYHVMSFPFSDVSKCFGSHAPSSKVAHPYGYRESPSNGSIKLSADVNKLCRC